MKLEHYTQILPKFQEIHTKMRASIYRSYMIRSSIKDSFAFANIKKKLTRVSFRFIRKDTSKILSEIQFIGVCKRKIRKWKYFVVRKIENPSLANIFSQINNGCNLKTYFTK